MDRTEGAAGPARHGSREQGRASSVLARAGIRQFTAIDAVDAAIAGERAAQASAQDGESSGDVGADGEENLNVANRDFVEGMLRAEGDGEASRIERRTSRRFSVRSVVKRVIVLGCCHGVFPRGAVAAAFRVLRLRRD